ncbi:MAG: hypothetical protein WC772_00115 [Candidatus Margulisiibacteriota bacterium]|jgi:hypothetical protein
MRRLAAPALLLAAQAGCEKSAAPIDARCINLPTSTAVQTPPAPTLSAPVVIETTKLDGIKSTAPALAPTSITIGKDTPLVFTFPEGTKVASDLTFYVRIFDQFDTSPYPLFDGTKTADNAVTVTISALSGRPASDNSVSLYAYDTKSNLYAIWDFNKVEILAAAVKSTGETKTPLPGNTSSKTPAATDPCAKIKDDDIRTAMGCQ